MTLSVLPAYRRRGVARYLVNWLKTEVKKWNAYEVTKGGQNALQVASGKEGFPPVPRNDIKKIGLHVQSSNTNAVKMYQSFGFKKEFTNPTYYGRLDDQAADYMTLAVEDF